MDVRLRELSRESWSLKGHMIVIARYSALHFHLSRKLVKGLNQGCMGGQRMKIDIHPSHPYRPKEFVHTSIFFR